MSLVATYVKAVNGKWYEDPILEGVSSTGHRWFLCFDDDDPPEFVYEAGMHSNPRQNPDWVLSLAGVDVNAIALSNESDRMFGEEWVRAKGYFVTITNPIPVPSKFDAVFDEKPTKQGCYYGFEPMKRKKA